MRPSASKSQAMTRWRGREFVARFLEQLRNAMRHAAQEQPSLGTLERNWRESAQEAGYPPQDIEESWLWFRRHAVEKAEPGTARETPPEGVQRVIEHNALFVVEYTPDVAADLLKDVGLIYQPPKPADEAWRQNAQAAGLPPQEI